MAVFHARDGAELHYHDIGQGPICVMLHGFGMASDLWLPLVWPLRKKHRFILLSQRGFGRSHQRSFSQSCAVSQLADDLADLLDHLQVVQCELAGYSMGACASMAYLSRYGEARISRYLQIDQAACVARKDDWEWPLFGVEHANRMLSFADLLAQIEAQPRHIDFEQLPTELRSQIGAAFAGFFDIAGHKLWLRGASQLMRWERLAKHFLPTANWRVYMHCMQAYHQQQYDFRQAIASISLPIWSFVGTESRMYPPEGQLRLSRLVSGPVQVVRFNGCGHALPFESPRRFTRKLGEFLQPS